jgi:hypothetical protein
MIGVLGRRTTNLSVYEQSCEAGPVPGPTFRIRPENDYSFASNELPSCCTARKRASRYESVITPSKLGALSTFLPENRPGERKILHVRPPIVKWVSFLSPEQTILGLATPKIGVQACLGPRSGGVIAPGIMEFWIGM